MFVSCQIFFNAAKTTYSLQFGATFMERGKFWTELIYITRPVVGNHYYLIHIHFFIFSYQKKMRHTYDILIYKSDRVATGDKCRGAGDLRLMFFSKYLSFLGIFFYHSLISTFMCVTPNRLGFFIIFLYPSQGGWDSRKSPYT